MKRKTAAGERGSVLMEYVVLCACVMFTILQLWRTQLYDADEGWTGKMGRGLVQYFQRVVNGIVLPVP